MVHESVCGAGQKSKNDPFKCDFPGCKYSGREKERFENHKKLVHSEKKTGVRLLGCQFCDFKTSSKVDLAAHAFSHEGDAGKAKTDRDSDKDRSTWTDQDRIRQVSILRRKVKY